MFEIIIGTYEQYLLGYKVQSTENGYQIEKSFTTHSHVGSIRAVATYKYYLASTGTDETICLYDMRYRRESGKLMHHQGNVNCLAFAPDGSHLFACSSDGSISAVRCGNWQIEKLWLKAHKSSVVNTFAIHQSGKLALSTGEDGVLRTWNLIKGRQAYATNLMPKLKLDAKWITVVKWSPDGDKYLLAANRNIYVYSVETAGIDKEFTFDSKVICAQFLTNTLIAIGHEDGKITFYNTILVDPHVMSIKAHNMRVKCIAHTFDLLVSASTSGEIKLWKYDSSSMQVLQTINCGARITCLSLATIYKQEKCEETNLEVEVKEEETDLTKESKNSDLTKEVVEIIDEEKDLIEEEKTDEEKIINNKKSKIKKKMKPSQIPNKEKDLVKEAVEVADEEKNLIEKRDKKKDLKVKSRKNKKVLQIPPKRSQNQDVKKRKLKPEPVHTTKKKKKKTIC